MSEVFRYIIVSINDSSITGTNDKEVALNHVACELDFYVIDTELSLWLKPEGAVEIKNVF